MEYFKILAAAPLLLAIYGCSSSDSSPPVNITPTVTSGFFVDVEVKGMGYTTASVSGQTDQYGAYAYAPGEDITFSIGGVTLGTIAGAPAITPNDFGTGDTILNVARFIQSLDVDSIPGNGIDVTQAAAALAGTTISSDVFLTDSATFEANKQILDAMVQAGKILIDAATAQTNLDLGTDSTFDPLELEDKAFVIIDPVSNAVGIIAFDATEVFSVMSTDTTSNGEDGLGADDTWSVDGNGVLMLQDPTSGSSTTINRIGSSTEAITVTFSEDGGPLQPATFVIPEPVTNFDLGGDDNTITSKTYDVVDQDGVKIGVTFVYDGISITGTYSVNGTTETGTFAANTLAPGVVTLVEDQDPTNVTLMIVLDGNATVVNDTATILLAGTTFTGGTTSDPNLEFNEIGLGSVTLRSVTP